MPVAMSELPAEVQEFIAPYRVAVSAMKKITDSMVADFKLGLSEGVPRSSTAMLPTFVPELPNGRESGRYLAMDLSGTHCRMLLLTLSAGTKRPDVLKRNFLLTPELLTGTGEELFDFLALCIYRFLDEHRLCDANLVMGFVFSYPCMLQSIRSAKLLWWTKGFKASGVIGSDVVRMLQDAIARRGDLKVRVKAIMNDSVGQAAAVAHAHKHEEGAAIVGVVVGNGCNAAYVEEVANMTKFKSDEAGYHHPQMVIDTEWEEFGNQGQLEFILTPLDKAIDESSVHKGRQIIDKLTASLYLGELCRRILAEMCEKKLVFSGRGSDALQTVDSFPSKYIAEILSDTEAGHYPASHRITDELHLQSVSTQDFKVMNEVATVLAERSAAIVSCAIAALLTVMNKPRVLVGVGGRLYQYLPTYQGLIERNLREIGPPGLWDIVSVPEGSGQGAALVAAVVERLEQKAQKS